MDNKELHMMIGGIGTGKTTHSQELVNDLKCKIFSADELAEQYSNENNIEELIDAEFKRQLKSGESFILDGKYLTVEGRKIILDNAKNEGYKIYGYDFGAGNVISLLRRFRKPRRLLKEIWEGIYENDKSSYETPEIEEGFEKINFPRKS